MPVHHRLIAAASLAEYRDVVTSQSESFTVSEVQNGNERIFNFPMRICGAVLVVAALAAFARAATTVSVDWCARMRAHDARDAPQGTVHTTATLQVVAHPLLMRGSPIHECAVICL